MPAADGTPALAVVRDAVRAQQADDLTAPLKAAAARGTELSRDLLDVSSRPCSTPDCP